MADYSYTAQDESLSTPMLYKFFVNPLVKILPYRMPANFITIAAFLCIVAAFCIAVYGYYAHSYRYWSFIPVLAFFYLVGDCADGKQARKTNTGSPLGEYLDHFLDSFVTGLLMGILLISFKVVNPVVITIGFFCLSFGQTGTFWERYKNHVIRFGKLSSSEGVAAIAFCSWFMSFTVIHRIGCTVALFGITWGEILIITVMAVTAFTAITAVLRTRGVSVRYLSHLILSCLFTGIVAYFFASNILYITIVVTFYNAFFASSLLAATNLKTQEKFPDILIPASCILFSVLPEYTVVIQWLQITYLVIRIILRFAAFFRLNRQYWYWINPLPCKNSNL